MTRYRKLRKQEKAIWFGLAFDPATMMCYVAGMWPGYMPADQRLSEAHSRAIKEIPNFSGPVKLFRFTRAEIVSQELTQWFKDCRVPSDHIPEFIRQVGKALNEILPQYKIKDQGEQHLDWRSRHQPAVKVQIENDTIVVSNAGPDMDVEEVANEIVKHMEADRESTE